MLPGIIILFNLNIPLYHTYKHEVFVSNFLAMPDASVTHNLSLVLRCINKLSALLRKPKVILSSTHDEHIFPRIYQIGGNSSLSQPNRVCYVYSEILERTWGRSEHIVPMQENLFNLFCTFEQMNFLTAWTFLSEKRRVSGDHLPWYFAKFIPNLSVIWWILYIKCTWRTIGFSFLHSFSSVTN